MQNLKDIFDEPFIDRLMANTHLKIYNFNDSEMQTRRKKSYKTDFKNTYVRKLAANQPKEEDEDENGEEKVDLDE